MFPNPQSVLPLPPHPTVARYKKIAKDLIKACKSGEPDAVRGWSEKWVRGLVQLPGLALLPELPARIEHWIVEVEEFARGKLLGDRPDARACTLADAQFVIARSHGFESWPKFAGHLEGIARTGSSVSRFEAAADAIRNGDSATLRRLLDEEPKLIRERSAREHGAALLHYVSANGIEGYRQQSPKNIVAIAELLLRAGAEVDATANVYGGGCTTLGLTATSVHPERAGVQEALMQVLIDHGAKVDRFLVIDCLNNGRLKAAEFLASRGAPLDLAGAAGIGRLDLVKTFFAEDGRLEPGTTGQQLNNAFLNACQYGRNEVVEFLLSRGVDVTVQSRDGQTGLHRAVIGGRLDTVNLLLRQQAPLEATNSYGGTVLGQALWSAAHGGDPDLYSAILEALIAAGARVPERHVPVNKTIDEWMAQHGSCAEPDWHWAGE